MKNNQLRDEKQDKELKYVIGCNAQENWNIIDSADTSDMWFHVADHPSAHVVLCTNGAPVSKRTIMHCAMECKNHSKMKDHKQIEITYTQICNVNKGKTVGSVHVRKTNSVVI
jgi:predicted ribosome quality control (RQC) complex YloA/Tae2 family protein